MKLSHDIDYFLKTRGLIALQTTSLQIIDTIKSIQLAFTRFNTHDTGVGFMLHLAYFRAKPSSFQ
jgi:hypothetical protein